ncbi:SAM-dependent methyltransferase [Dysgonomonas sp. 216]|uniref:class I SAM-dependent methyltransferase n=1 Tax=Dysgonomonas sp. 216 TaxID=2302934 RepID=UPI0013D296AD|nr:RsmD family RNA methyltransferase [Dysgonomonas sp. 216]NDW18938.1 SAM-dependent methyltransferase [Dysgonomonas sp. 216]
MNSKTLQFISEHENDDVRSLALQSKRHPDIDISFAVSQIAGRQIARNKIPSWYANKEIIYPPHLSLEQCSSEHTAIYKANLCSGGTLVDLTGGLGVDFSFMSRQFNGQAVYVEQQPELAELAKHNFDKLKLANSIVINTDAKSHLLQMDSVDTIFIDPGRRDTKGKKTVLIEECSPNIIELDDYFDAKSRRTIIKLSPMLDISAAIKHLKNISEVHVISVNNECKELLFIKDKYNQNIEPIFHCINISNSKTEKYSFTKTEESDTTARFSDKALLYLYEPNTSVMKAGAYKKLCSDFKLLKLHPNSHLYTANEHIEDFPGRKFIVQNCITFNKKEIKSALTNISKANISARNFPLSVDKIKKKISVKDGGDIYIFATTLSDNKKVLLICEKL